MQINIINIADSKNYDKKPLAAEGIIIFSDEWETRKEQCKNFIKSRNHINDRSIHGRKCTVKTIDKIQGKEFLNKHHIQGANRLSIILFGLFYEAELIGVMSLGRHSRQIAQNRIVLDRFCIAYGVHVKGGASKLFSHCVKWAKRHKYDEIISFSDNRWTDGKIYEILRFSLEKNHKPDYCYVDTKNPVRRLSKQSQKKSSSKCPEGMTELEWADLRGLKRLWDKGKKRWVYHLDPNAVSWKEKLSAKCAAQNQNGNFKHSHIRGYFQSDKCNTEIYYGSSYELRCMYLLERNPKVKNYKRAEVFVDRDKRSRNPDLHVEYIDDSIEILEIKPENRLQEEDVKKQVEETALYAAQNGFAFSVWHEAHSGLANDKSIIKWAKRFIAETTGNTEWIERQLENNRKRSKKHYHTKISTDTVEIYCEYCSKTHTPLRKTYENNIERNDGNYICERYGGHLAGKKPGKKKVNPHAKDGKKQCNRCKKIKLFEEFGIDKIKSDGHATRCKKCRAEVAIEKYNSK